MKVGKLTVIVGSMFSGKSSELLRQGRRHVLAGKRVLYAKPATDRRYSVTQIVTHDRTKAASVVLATGTQLCTHLLTEGAEVALIDEGQFFDDSLVRAIRIALLNGVDVIVSGLDLDRHGEPFGIMPYLMAIADQVMKLHAVCAECGQDAYVSYGEFEDESQVVLGASEKYKPLCRSCWTEIEARATWARRGGTSND